MANGKFRRRRSRRHVRCVLCTSNRDGNSRHACKPKEYAAAKAAEREMKQYATR